jgi:hypothetical protein
MAMVLLDKRRLLALLAIVSGIVLILGAGTAFAEDGRGKAQGGGSAQPTVTEDDDSDGVPNEPDPIGDADNQHPSGKDKHAEAGGSGNQGKAASTPDQDGRGPDRDQGGTDKPDGPGGADILDQDGNNGCGNDDDFDDDNEGWCGRPTVSETPPEIGGTGGTGGTGSTGGTEVAGNRTSESSVLGARIERKPEEAAVLGARLARTGFDVFLLMMIGTALVVLGGVSLIRQRRPKMDRSSS